ncbi:hypothetical protein ACOMHN_034418 [Nucella lapillus]
MPLKKKKDKEKDKGEDKEGKDDGKDPGDSFAKQLSALLEAFNMRDVVLCLFYIINTLAAVMSAFLAAGGAVALIMSMGLSDAGEFSVEGKPSVKLLMVTGAKVVGILAGGVGFLQCLIAIFGCCGMMYRGPTMLKAFGGLCVVMAFFNLIIMVYLSYHIYQVENDGFRTKLMETIKRYDGGNNFDTFIIDQAQVKLSCCGISDRKDYLKSKWYTKGNSSGVGLPRSCCQLKTKQKMLVFDFSRRELSDQDLLEPSCPNQPAGKAFTTVPCLEKIKDMLFSAFVVALTAAVFAILLQVGACTIAVLTARQMQGGPTVTVSLKKSGSNTSNRSSGHNSKHRDSNTKRRDSVGSSHFSEN